MNCVFAGVSQTGDVTVLTPTQKFPPKATISWSVLCRLVLLRAWGERGVNKFMNADIGKRYDGSCIINSPQLLLAVIEPVVAMLPQHLCLCYP